MAYTLESFCKDAREILKKDVSRMGVEEVRKKMARLVADASFVAKYYDDTAEAGARRIYADPELGFEVLVYRSAKTRTSPAHDHGDSWALYAQVRDYTEMTEWQRTDDGSDPGRATLAVQRKYKLNAGEVGLYWGSQLHSTYTPEGCCYLRVTGTDLEQRPRVRIDQNTGKVMV
ncbi:MAG: hypothetical protein GEV05_22485 [Betaproteobacteria bacterium]|nr:hypothetical protein [Betaproteobacteria bacterium]